jgi:hypothetical protein
MRGLAAALLAVSVLVAPVAEGQPRDPRLDWRTVRTEHFSVHYHEPLGMLARRVASVSEQAHRTLTRVLDYEPDSRTQIVLTDDSDAANGSATALPRNEIRLFASAPGDLSVLNDYDDWLTTLVTHEHTHILHLDNVGGIPAIINAIFGKIVSPNNAQPRWFIEGLATYEESKETSGGRLRSSMAEMYMRMDALEGRLLELDQLSHQVDRWPRGNTWYLYGARFVNYIAERHGHDALVAMTYEYGSATLPYGLNRVARRATGQSFVELYQGFLDHLRHKHRQTKQRVIRRGRIEGRRITHHGERARSPRFLDDERVVYFVNDAQDVGRIRSLNAKTGKNSRKMVRVAGNAYMAEHPNGKHIYYSSVDTHRDIYRLYDLFRYNRKTGERTRLTHGLRAREPDISPDGRKIVYTVNSAGTRHLMIAPIDAVEESRRVLVRSKRFEQIYTPRFSPSGEHVAFSEWRDGGYRDIRVVDLESGDVRNITKDRALDTGPTWSPDGKWLYFSSDRTGIANIYAYHRATGKLHQVTNVVGGAYHPAISPDGDRLVYLGYTSRGFDLYSMSLDPRRFLDAPAYTGDRPEPSETDSTLPLDSEPYRPVYTLAPQAWQLDLSSGAFGRQLGIRVHGEDMVRRHVYDAEVRIPFERGDVNTNLNWTYRRLPVPIHLRFTRRIAPRGGLRVGGEQQRWIEEAIGGEVGISYRFPRSFHSESIRLSYALTHIGKGEPFGGKLDPNDPPPVLPERGWLARLRAGWSYSDLQRQVFDISPTGGRAASINLSIADPLIGSDFRSVSLSWSLAQFIENPFVEHHVLAVRYGGGISGGDLGRRGVFSVGGFPDVPLTEALIDDVVLGGVQLRGYPPFSRSGTQFHLLQAEYRFPVWRPMSGVQTLPVYIKRMHASVFVDYGDAFFGKFDLDTFRVGTGAELLTDFTLGYFINLTLRTGFAWGFHENGGAQYYVNIGVPF